MFRLGPLHTSASQVVAKQLIMKNVDSYIVKTIGRDSPILEAVKVLWRNHADRYLGRRVLAHFLNRNFDDLLKRTLSPLVEEGLLKTAFPSSSDPRQAYTTSRETE